MARPAFGLLLLLLAITTVPISSQPFPTLPGLQLGVTENQPSRGSYAPPQMPAASGMVSFPGGKGRYKRMAREFLESHNMVRGVHGEAPFVWDRRLARYARRWSAQLRDDCRAAHSGGPYGENIFWGTGWDWTASDAVRSWASEHIFYNRGDNSCQPGRVCGHYTQIVWNDTVRVGCARVECYGGGIIISCNYDPPGNWLGERPFI